MKQEGFAAYGHDVGEHFAIGPVRVEVTPADHAWQNASSGASDRMFEPEDCWGFWIDTPDGINWAPGDWRLISDHHLRMPAADAMLFDFSDSEWHFGLDGAIAMANVYSHTPRCCCTTGGAWTPPTSRRSTPTRTHCRTASKTRNASSSWRQASPSCCGD
ncbi:MAG TPA: MBL fold metallo-hydrolase [Propionibacteriaceae bacterium]